MTHTITAPHETTTALPTSAFARTPAQSNREEVFETHAYYRRTTSLPSGRGCMSAPMNYLNGVSVYRTVYKNGKNRASAAVQTCKGDMCPWCAPRKTKARLDNIVLAIRQFIKDGGECIYMVFGAEVKKSKTPAFYNVENIIRDSQAYAEATPKGMPAKQVRAIRNQMIADYMVKHPKVDSHLTWEPNVRYEAVKNAQASVFTAGGYAREKKEYGVVGTLKSIEEDITPEHFPNGARNYNFTGVNVHMNAVIFVEKPLSDSDLKTWEERMLLRWSKSMARSGYKAVKNAQFWNAAHGDDIEKIARYIDKQAMEFVYDRHNHADRFANSVTKAQVLKDARGDVISDRGEFLDSNASAMNFYRNYEQVKRDRNSFMKSHHFFEKMGVATQIEERAAELKATSNRVVVVQLQNEAWGTLSKGKGVLKGQLFNMIENTKGSEKVSGFLESHGIAHAVPAVTHAPFTKLEDVPNDTLWDTEQLG